MRAQFINEEEDTLHPTTVWRLKSSSVGSISEGKDNCFWAVWMSLSPDPVMRIAIFSPDFIFPDEFNFKGSCK